MSNTTQQMLDILETYGGVDEHHNDHRVEYALMYTSSEYGNVLIGKMMLSKKDALMDLYNALMVEIHDEVQLIESKIPASA